MAKGRGLLIVIGPAKGKLDGQSKQWSPKADDAYDKAHGIKEGSKKDNALDRKRGVPVKKKGK